MNPVTRMALALLVLVAFFIGCSEDNDPVSPPATGTITVSPEPSDINAPWQLTGVGAFNQSGTGSTVLTDMSIGDYTIAWGTVNGWIAPIPATQSQFLIPNGNLTFSGTYTAQAGTITISPQPSWLNAQWSITGPEGYSNSGTGLTMLTGRVAGDYSLTWIALAGWTTPSPATVTQTLELGGTLMFVGEYTQEGPTPPPGFVYIQPGKFMMGSPSTEPGRQTNEGPQHEVILTQGFFMSQYEVTEQLWCQVMGCTPTTSQLPKNYVSWDMAVEFCNALSIKEGLTPAYTIHGPIGDVTWNQGADGYRLPTEAEWEYACRAGSTTAFANGRIRYLYCGPLDPNLDAMGWYCANSGEDRHPVGKKKANAWGLYDMHGNLWEWVWCGWYREYTLDPVTDPVYNVGSGAERAIRGGGWGSDARHCRSAFRSFYYPDSAFNYRGFRIVRTAS